MPTLCLSSLQDQGFHIIEDVLDSATIRRCIEALNAHQDSTSTRSRRGGTYAMRNLLTEIPFIRQFAESSPLRAIVDPILGAKAIPVRAILFDKNPKVNWAVPWHQDCAIAVQEKIETAGFGPWSIKAGVHHVEPPVEVLEYMVTLRVHLDDCDEFNGPLRVIPRSHRHGKLDDEAVTRWVHAEEMVPCCVKAGGVVIMRPLLLHASSQVSESSCSDHRRVVHVEYANVRLTGGLRWFEMEPVSNVMS